MSSFSRRIAFLSLAALASCGFQPVYGPEGSGTQLRSAVRLDPPSDRNGFLFLAQVERRLGAPQAPRFQLSYGLTVSSQAVETAAGGSVTRTTLLGQADYVLINLASGATVASGAVDGFAGYSATGSQLATLSAQNDASARLMVLLADRLVTRLYALDPLGLQ